MFDMKSAPDAFDGSSTSITSSFAVPGPPTCIRCRNHKLTISEKGHMAFCKFKHCKCAKCRQTDERHRALASQTLILQNEEEKITIECNEDTLTSPTISIDWHDEDHPMDMSSTVESSISCDSTSTPNCDELPTESLDGSSDLNSPADFTGLIGEWSKSHLAPILQLLALSLADQTRIKEQELLSITTESDKTFNEYNEDSENSLVDTFNHKKLVNNDTEKIESQVLQHEPSETYDVSQDEHSNANQDERPVKMQCETAEEVGSTQLEKSQGENSANIKDQAYEDAVGIVSPSITELAERAATAAMESMEEKILQGLQNINLSENLNGDETEGAQDFLTLKNDIVNIITGEIELKMEELLLSFDKGLVLN